MTWHGPPEFAIEPNLSDDEEEHWRFAIPRALDRLWTRLADHVTAAEGM